VRPATGGRTAGTPSTSPTPTTNRAVAAPNAGTAPLDASNAPPMAGPTMVDSWNSVDDVARARCSPSRGTSDGRNAELAGFENARTVPIARENATTTAVVGAEVAATTASPVFTSAIDAWHAARISRRSKRSAVWPAARDNNATGANWARPTHARSSGSPVSPYSHHPSVVSWIWPANMPQVREARNRRNAGRVSGFTPRAYPRRAGGGARRWTTGDPVG
jgi:hypothetical protein